MLVRTHPHKSAGSALRWTKSQQLHSFRETSRTVRKFKYDEPMQMKEREREGVPMKNARVVTYKGTNASSNVKSNK